MIDGCDVDMTDRNNSKVLSQKICKCGNAVADVIGRIDVFARNLEKVRFGESSPVLKMYEESVNVVEGTAKAVIWRYYKCRDPLWN